ncbi:UNVERIFIED_CONTAM: hypothetical protein PYX00_007600 [Menopon gallinae]|uniref:Heat shock protein 70 n=1 Tax=Menopon gallinae TaxID=328185 RepID=A0AAW2HKJ3_9NEOP
MNEERLFTPEEISAMVLQKMKETAETFLGEKVTDVVVTVPAHFNNSQRQATIDAGTIAGLKISQIINEPTAAALAYGLDKNLEGEKNILVFDLGGGTFDVSILTINGTSNVFQVKATAGDSHLGGQDFDNILVAHLIDEFKRKHKKNIGTNARAVSRLRTAAERAKRILSSTTEANIDIDALAEGIDLYTRVSRARFEELCLDLFNSTLEPVDRALKDAKLEKEDIHEVVLVGGSTRIPKIQALLHEYFERKHLNFSINPDEAIAYGAAVHAAALSRNHDHVRDLILVDVTPLSLGIETAGSIMSKIIERNTKIPCKKKEMFTTFTDNQPIVTIQVYEGERSLTKDNHLLGKFDLVGIPPAPHGYPQIEVTFEIDSNGMLNVSAKDIRTGRNNKIQLKNGRSHLSSSEMNRMIMEAERFKEQDKKRREECTVRHSLERLTFNMRKLTENSAADSLSEKQKYILRNSMDEVVKWLDNNPHASVADIKSRHNELEKFSGQLTSKTNIPKEWPK